MKKITLREREAVNTKRFYRIMAVVGVLALIAMINSVSYTPIEEPYKELRERAEVQAGHIEELEKVIEELQVDEVEVVEVEEISLVNYDYDHVERFLRSYGSRIDSEYLELLAVECKDVFTLETVVAISIAESGAGKALPNRESNFWGWFKGGDRNYDPSREVMAKEICKGISTWYPEIRNGVGVDVYTGGDRSGAWYGNVQWALNEMNK
jgi:hypothetical protein